ncbi:MAG TPA: 4-hydroxybenzoate octaprenyltransferase, partial [Verrucomicrobiae bacterium]|nr:4-hydroxybenzoate octaprenyltransferase [Verrucomicrobiae bacterium]
GPQNALKAAFISHCLTWGLLTIFGMLAGFKIAYFTGMLVIFVCLMFEHWLAARRSLNWVNVAFFRLNALISMVFLVIVLAEVMFPGFRLAR